MPALQITFRRRSYFDPKEALRAHVEQLSPDKQREFVAVALQLIAERPQTSEFGVRAAYRQLLQREMNDTMI